MLQVLQSLKTGETRLEEVPVPQIAANSVLIATRVSLLSAGTERMLIDFGKASLVNKARQQPDKVRMVLDKVRADGLGVTLQAVKSKLDQPVPLGYCNVGTIAAIGSNVERLAIGDRVVSNGAHAEYVSVSKNLCAKIPSNVSDDQAAFTVLAAIGLQGIRLAAPSLGECVVVTGLGLIGLLTVQMLRAQGCRVLGIDLDSERLEMARSFGAEVVNLSNGGDPIASATTFSRGRGVDAVLITASTQSSEPVSQAAKMCRKRGRIVLVGATGLELSRADFYEKELTFQVSCSYGPGRYDPAYEEGGHDYPVGYVRWTEQRNFEAVLDLMASGQLDVLPLITHRFAFEHAVQAYELLGKRERSLGILLNYSQPSQPNMPQRRIVKLTARETEPAKGGVAFIGAGNYASRTLIPAFKRAGARLDAIVSVGGVSAAYHGRKHGFARASSDPTSAIRDDSVSIVVVATRHNTHGRYVLEALRAGKHVFCEKPLCLTLDELSEIEAETLSRPTQHLTVGFNRRFAPQILKTKDLLAEIHEPKSLIMTVNAGAVPPGHWVQDPEIGGGRIVGEGCHFIDLLCYLAGSSVASVSTTSLAPQPGFTNSDKTTIVLSFANGSVGTVHYLANGHKGFPKERLEIFCAGRVIQLDNFRKLRAWGWKGFSRDSSWRQDKGAEACVKAFVEAVQKGAPPIIPREEIFEVSRISIEAAEATR
jgi:predicted dehydrogenase/threonine dehydrogenase-like Zn-dependent dehydrogenase